MDIELHYCTILGQIQQGHRGLVRFSAEEIEQLIEALKQTMDLRNISFMEKVLCLIEHSASLESKFEDSLIQALKLDLPDHLIIFALNCSRKHIIQVRAQRGHRLTADYLEVLKELLMARSPEVVEWTLRTIEECGNQGVYFLREFDKIKPPPWKWFNSHQRAVRELITLLERRWSHFEKSKPK